MRTRNGTIVARLAGLVIAALTPVAGAQTLEPLLVPFQPLPGGGGALVESVGQVEVNDNGGYAAYVSTAIGVPTELYLWGSVDGGPPGILRTMGGPVSGWNQEFSWDFDLADDGRVVYLSRVTASPIDLDSVWVDDTLVVLDGSPVAFAPTQDWLNLDDVEITAAGNPYFRGTYRGPPMATVTEGIFHTGHATPLYLEGTTLPGIPDPLTSVFGPGARSEQGTHDLAIVSTSETSWLVHDGAPLVVGGQPVATGTPIPTSIGGAAGATWGFPQEDSLDITESAGYCFTTGGFEQVFVRDGFVVHRSGESLDGLAFDWFRANDLNSDGDLLSQVRYTLPDGSLLGDALVMNGRVLLRTGDLVDLDGDGTPDTDAFFHRFEFESTPKLSRRLPDGSVDVFVRLRGNANPEPVLTFDDFVVTMHTNMMPPRAWLVLGRGPGAAVSHPGDHAFTTQLADIRQTWPVEPDDVPGIPLPQVGGMHGSALGGPPGNPQHTRTFVPGATFAVQVLLWDPANHPAMPEQWSAGLQIGVLSNGQIITEPFGTSTGITIQPEVVRLPDGSHELRLPFTIP